MQTKSFIEPRDKADSCSSLWESTTPRRRFSGTIVVLCGIVVVSLLVVICVTFVRVGILQKRVDQFARHIVVHDKGCAGKKRIGRSAHPTEENLIPTRIQHAECKGNNCSDVPLRVDSKPSSATTSKSSIVQKEKHEFAAFGASNGRTCTTNPSDELTIELRKSTSRGIGFNKANATLVIKRNGPYFIHADVQVIFPTVGNEGARLKLMKNGKEMARTEIDYSLNETAMYPLSLGRLVKLEKGDEISLKLYATVEQVCYAETSGLHVAIFSL